MMYLFAVLLVTFLEATPPRPVSGTLQCYSGFVSSNGLSLSNWTCDHISTHQMPVLGPDGNITYTQVNYSLHSQKSDQYADIKYCVIFDSSAGTDYHCDYDYICPRYITSDSDTKTIQGINIKGVRGTLHCCSHDLCNDETSGKSLKHVGNHNSVMCYSGTNKSYTIQNCHGSNWCIRSVIKHPSEDLKVTTYGCDTRNLCHKYSTSDERCHNITAPDTKQKKMICCCSSDLCNSNGLLGDVTTVSLYTVPKHDLSPMPSHLLPTHSNILKHWMSVGGIIAGVMFGLLLFIVVAVAIKHYREQQNAELIYSYTQLSADLADDRVTDDEQMLVG